MNHATTSQVGRGFTASPLTRAHCVYLSRACDFFPERMAFTCVYGLASGRPRGCSSRRTPTGASSSHSLHRPSRIGIMKLNDSPPKDEAAQSRWAASNRAHKRRRNTYAQKTLEHYGTECACCGTNKSVSVWPVDLTVSKASLIEDGSGRPYRSGSFNAWLLGHNLPEGFKTYCTPCVTRKRGPYGCSPAMHAEGQS